ncbi:MAG: cupin domain-containing protein [Thermoleophilia bacterium]|nr:cupin domain-containing protein [Thermoleophilia bacterium]MDQ3857968.1 cupin domain-containing protein [Actinomycetota bacterium]
MNVQSDQWDVERESVRIRHIGHRLGSELIGGVLLELRPGHRGPYHLHHGNEELALVVAGTPTVRGPADQRQLGPGDLAFFPRGPEGLHALENHSQEPARVLLLSSKVSPDVTERPDESLVGVFAGDVPTLGRDAPFEAFFPVDAARRG